jgi:hypothetical protein
MAVTEPLSYAPEVADEFIRNPEPPSARPESKQAEQAPQNNDEAAASRECRINRPRRLHTDLAQRLLCSPNIRLSTETRNQLAALGASVNCANRE